jgi:hypothetical protein
MNKPRHPVFLCDPVENQWTFWCPYCRTQHWHSNSRGHRVAHCFSAEGRAAFDRGYILQLHPRHRQTHDEKEAAPEVAPAA